MLLSKVVDNNCHDVVHPRYFVLVEHGKLERKLALIYCILYACTLCAACGVYAWTLARNAVDLLVCTAI